MVATGGRLQSPIRAGFDYVGNKTQVCRVLSSMRHLIEYYRARATECERQAEETKDERTRQQYHLLAEHWRRLADQFEKHGL